MASRPPARLLAALLALAVPLPGAANVLPVPAADAPAGPSALGAAGSVTPQAFLDAVEFHLSRPDLSLGSVLPDISLQSVSQPARVRVERADLHAAEYLSRASLRTSAEPETAAKALAARFLSGALADPEQRGKAASFLSEQGGEAAERVAQKLSVAGWAADGMERLQQLSDDTRAGPAGVSPLTILDALFDGTRQAAPVSAAPSLDTPGAFASYAERRFAAGRLARGQHAAVVAGAQAQGRTFQAHGIPSDQELYDRVALSPLGNAERQRVIVELFEAAGAKPEEIKLQDAGRGRSNVYVVKKGRTDRVIVVGGHHDKVRAGAGTIDNWTGATMVANLYQALRGVETEAAFVFIAFAREEEGLIGSKRYLSELSKAEKLRIDSMVNLDTLAVDGTFSWKNNSTKPLLEMVMKVARESRLGLKEEWLWGGDADSSSFRREDIPAITLFGASRKVIFKIIHSARDTIAAFSLPHYKNAYLLTLEFLKRLDAEPVRRPGLLARLAGWLTDALRPA